MTNDDQKTVNLVEVDGKKRTAIGKGSIYNRIPRAVFKWLDSNNFDDFLHAEFVLTKNGKHAILLKEAEDE